MVGCGESSSTREARITSLTLVYQPELSRASSPMDYRESLNPWALFRSLPGVPPGTNSRSSRMPSCVQRPLPTQQWIWKFLPGCRLRFQHKTPKTKFFKPFPRASKAPLIRVRSGLRSWRTGAPTSHGRRGEQRAGGAKAGSVPLVKHPWVCGEHRDESLASVSPHPNSLKLIFCGRCLMLAEMRGRVNAARVSDERLLGPPFPFGVPCGLANTRHRG